MLEYLDEGAYELWKINGGLTTLESYRTSDGPIDLPDDHVDFLRATALYHETEEFFFVHAGLKPHMTIEENLNRAGEDVFLWERGHLNAGRLNWEKPVVCGHTPHADPIDRDRLIMIDTGCVYHQHPHLGRLTAVHLPERDFVSVRYVG